MCQVCILNARRILPHLTDREVVRVLMSATAFPFGSVETVEMQLQRWAGMPVAEILRTAGEEMDAAMEGK